jgi:hypothetical protein
MTIPLIAQTQLIMDFISGQGWDTRQELGYPLLPGPFIERSPDKCVFITGTGGPGYVLDGAADSSTFQARVRGAQHDQFSAELAAERLDVLFYLATFPATVDGIAIVLIARLGSGPTPLGSGPDDAMRWEYTCNYAITTGV